MDSYVHNGHLRQVVPLRVEVVVITGTLQVNSPVVDYTSISA